MWLVKIIYLNRNAKSAGERLAMWTKVRRCSFTPGDEG